MFERRKSEHGVLKSTGASAELRPSSELGCSALDARELSVSSVRRVTGAVQERTVIAQKKDGSARIGAGVAVCHSDRRAERDEFWRYWHRPYPAWSASGVPAIVVFASDRDRFSAASCSRSNLDERLNGSSC